MRDAPKASDRKVPAWVLAILFVSLGIYSVARDWPELALIAGCGMGLCLADLLRSL